MSEQNRKFSFIRVDIDNHVATITLYRPKRGNSITPEMGNELQIALQQLEQDSSVRVLILTGSGKFFCTGMDLGNSNQEQIEKNLRSKTGASFGIQLFESLKSFPKPIITRINGPAMGGGWGIVFTSDIRIAHKDAWFWFAEVKRGIVPAMISAYIVPQIGSFHARQYMLTGQKISAAKALELGFVSCVAKDDDEMNALTQSYVDELLSSAPGAMAIIKSTIDHVESHSHEQNLVYVENVFKGMVHAPEALYGMSCFVQKKKPNWNEFVQTKTAKL